MRSQTAESNLQHFRLKTSSLHILFLISKESLYIHLKETVPDKAVAVSGMTLVRNDRTYGTGGGVALYVNNKIPFKIRKDLNDPLFECQWVTLRPKWLPRAISKIAVCCVYLPPSHSEIDSFYDYFYNCYDKLCTESPNSAFIVSGDFNPTSNGFQQSRLNRHCSLKQVVKVPTRNNNILDLIFTNIAHFYINPEVLAPLSTSDHNIVLWKARTDASVVKAGNIVKVKVRDLNHTSTEQFGVFLENYDWSELFSNKGLDEKVDAFLHFTKVIINEFFPERIIKKHTNDKPFMTQKIKSLMDKRNKAFKNNKTELFKYLRRQVSAEIKKAKLQFYDKKVRPNHSSCPKAWWKQVKRLIGSRKNAVTLVDSETNLQMNDKQSADSINNFFANLTLNYPHISNEWLEMQCPDDLPLISVEEVARELNAINVNKAPGPNDPPLKILKMFSKLFAVPLAEIFNESFQTKKFPVTWKKYKVTGIPKITPCTIAENLRPIALTSVLSKVQESFTNKWINEDINGKISNSQYGGLPGSSTLYALLNLLHNWYRAMDEPQRVIRIIFLDFRKAFDLINHNILLRNMKEMGVRLALIQWFGTYLNKRSHFTKFGNDTSDYAYINGGVPQGSKLGPIAFVIKIDKLPSVIKEEIQLMISTNMETNVILEHDTLMFMDDTTLYEVLDVSHHISGKQLGGAESKVKSVLRFTEEDMMELNQTKCKEMIIDFRKNVTVIPPLEINSHVFERVKCYKLLGLWIDDNLKWSTNTCYIVKKAVKRLYFLKMLKGYGAPKQDLKAFYMAVIRSTLEYCAQIWHGNLTKEQSTDIERVQKRALRIICPGLTYEEALLDCNLKTLKARREEMCGKLIKTMIDPRHRLHSLLPETVNQIRQRQTRSNGEKLYNFRYRTERFKNSPIVYGIECFNRTLESK